MKPYTTITSKAVPLDIPNVDTDQIIPKQFLKRVERTGFGQFLFFDWRYVDDKDNPDFVLNKDQYKEAKILLARENFGCGSSREHAPWALLDYGFQVIIAPSFADIFYNNCFQNGILPITLSSDQMDELFKLAKTGNHLTADLENQTVSCEDKLFSFEIDTSKKNKLLKGLDDISSTLLFEEKISEFEKANPVY